MSPHAIKTVADYANLCGEGPLWHKDQGLLYWTDIPGAKMYAYNPQTGEHGPVYQGRPVGGYTIQPDGELVLFRDKGNVVGLRPGPMGSPELATETRTLCESIPGLEETRFNDVIADPVGRVFAGTMPGKTGDNPVTGKLYRFDPGAAGKPLEVLTNRGICNGMGFSPDGKTFYFTDTTARTVWAYDYDQATGQITNERAAVTLPESANLGQPDGMTVDAEGCFWIAAWSGSAVHRFSPAGELLSSHQLPCPKVTCCTFIGPDHTDLYITSAGGQYKNEDGPDAGALFCMPNAGQGVAEFQSKL